MNLSLRCYLKQKSGDRLTQLARPYFLRSDAKVKIYLGLFVKDFFPSWKPLWVSALPTGWLPTVFATDFIFPARTASFSLMPWRNDLKQLIRWDCTQSLILEKIIQLLITSPLSMVCGHGAPRFFCAKPFWVTFWVSALGQSNGFNEGLTVSPMEKIVQLN